MIANFNSYPQNAKNSENFWVSVTHTARNLSTTPPKSQTTKVPENIHYFFRSVLTAHTRCGRQSRIESISMLSASASPFSRRWMIDPCSQGPSTGPVHSFLFSGLYASLLFFRETLKEFKPYKICWIQFQTICPKFTCQSVPAPKFFSMTLLYTARSGFPPLSVNACCQSCQMREYEIMHFISSWRCWPDVGYNSTAWGGNLFWRFCNTVHTGYNAIGYSAKMDIVPTLTHMWEGPN